MFCKLKLLHNTAESELFYTVVWLFTLFFFYKYKHIDDVKCLGHFKVLFHEMRTIDFKEFIYRRLYMYKYALSLHSVILF